MLLQLYVESVIVVNLCKVVKHAANKRNHIVQSITTCIGYHIFHCVGRPLCG